MSSKVKKWLSRQSWHDIQKKLSKIQGKKSLQGRWQLRVVVYAVLVLALISIISPGISKRAIEKLGIDAPQVFREPEQKSPYVPPIYDPIAAQKKATLAIKSTGSDYRYSKLEVLNFIDHKNIPPGAEVLAKLISGASNGLIKAELTEDLKFDGDVFLPRRTILIGKGTSSNERLYIEFNKAVAPGNKAQKIFAEGFDFNDRLVGLKGKKVSDYAFKIAASSGLVFLGAMAEGLQEDQGLNPLGSRKKSMHDAALQGVATSTAEQGRRLIDSMDNQTKIEVRSDTSIIIIFNEVENGR
jgi:hypothetical protein